MPPIASLVSAIALCTAAAPSQGPLQVLTNDTFPFDNVAGRLVQFGAAALHPLEFSRDGSQLFALNQPGAHLAILDPATLSRLGDVQIGIGAVTVVARPGSQEVWVVDAVDSSVSVVDLSLQSIVRTIRVGAEPYGLVFPPSADRAYVTCSGVDRVDVIDTSTYAVVNSIAIPARCPRGIAYLAGKAYVASWLSGNGSAPMGNVNDPNDVEEIGIPGPPTSNALPDQDLFVIRSSSSPQTDTLDPSATVTGLGTTLFNLHVRPGTNELWIPNTEALNAVHKGEVNFVAGQVVSNRITIVDATGTLPPNVIDLDAIAPLDHKCAQPAYVEFDPSGSRAYVCGYGSDLVAVLDLGTGGAVTWAGSVDLRPSSQHARGTGPRACEVDPSRTALIAYNGIDASATRIDLAGLPSGSGWSVAAPAALKLGVDITSLFEHLGRHILTDATLSASKTSSCASCHVEGHTDGLVWDLSHYLEPEGTPNDQLFLGTDIKGPMVTQSLRRMAESGPYHWRGENPDLTRFQQAFPNLLEHRVNGALAGIGSDFEYMLLYVNGLAWPPNPRQSLDRRFTAEQLQGAALFQTRPVAGSLTCGSCHVLPIGAAGEIVAESAGGVIHSADVPGLRGVADKASPPFDLGGPYGERCELGAGFTHAGALPTVEGAFFGSTPAGSGHHSFALAAAEADHIASFLDAFDTGVAPAAAFMVTARADNWASVAAKELPLLRDAAARGHCDLVYHRVPRVILGQSVELSGVYDPATGKYRVASAAAAPIDEATLLGEAAHGLPVTFVGVPLGMGESQGLDRDMDGLFDLDEMLAGTDPENADTDRDGFPDGYEVLWGMNPLQADVSSPDTQAPSLVGSVRLDYATTNALKFQFETSEFCRVAISYNGRPPVIRIPFNQTGDHRHWYVLNQLQPDTDYQITLEMRDAAGNVATDSSTTFRTLRRATPDPARVDSLGLTLVPAGSGTRLRAMVRLKVGNVGAGPGYVVTPTIAYIAPDGTLSQLTGIIGGLSNASGTAILTVDLPASGPQPGTIYFVVGDVAAPLGSSPYALGASRMTVATLAY